jgi:hypothetical protein
MWPPTQLCTEYATETPHTLWQPVMLYALRIKQASYTVCRLSVHMCSHHGTHLWILYINDKRHERLRLAIGCLPSTMLSFCQRCCCMHVYVHGMQQALHVMGRVALQSMPSPGMSQE